MVGGSRSSSSSSSLAGLLLVVLHLPLSLLATGFGDWRDNYVVQWYAPFHSGGGYCTEAISFLQALRQSGVTVIPKQHGDSPNPSFIAGLTDKERALLVPNQPSSSMNGVIAICHSEPGAQHLPYPHYHTTRCPPEGADISITRTMFETDRLPDGWPARLALQDYVLVPTEFARDIFVRALTSAGAGAGSRGRGRDAERMVRVLGEPVDSEFYHPVFGDGGPDGTDGPALAQITDVLASTSLAPLIPFLQKRALIFLFCGKWEHRKGVDVLVEAFDRAFDARDNVLLLMLTSGYHAKGDWLQQAAAEIRSKAKPKGETEAAPRLVITALPQALMPTLYSLPGVFLTLTSRGEGWGRPHVEAMSCGKPIIATNWSGTTAYLSQFNAYPVPVRGLEPVGDAWKGHEWARIDPEDVKDAMLRLQSDYLADLAADAGAGAGAAAAAAAADTGAGEGRASTTGRGSITGSGAVGSARAKGRQARADMMDRYSPAEMGRQFVSLMAELVAEHEAERSKRGGHVRDRGRGSARADL